MSSPSPDQRTVPLFLPEAVPAVAAALLRTGRQVPASASTVVIAPRRCLFQEVTMTVDPTSAALQPAGDRTAAAASARK
jgi:hypothetical protein